MLDWILVTCLILYLIISLSEEYSIWRGGVMLDWILVTCLILSIDTSLSRRVYGGEELC
jgi:hypothetical protein